MLRSCPLFECLAGEAEWDVGGSVQCQQCKACGQHQLEPRGPAGEHAGRVRRHVHRGKSPGATERNGRRNPEVHHQAPRLARRIDNTAQI